MPHLRARLKMVQGTRSEREWARELGLPQQTVNRWKNGAVPSTYLLMRVCLYESISFEWLALGCGPMDKDYDPAASKGYLDAGVAEKVVRNSTSGCSEARGNTAE